MEQLLERRGSRRRRRPPVLRLLLAVLVLAFAGAMLVARRSEGSDEVRSAAELLGAATGEPV